MMSELMRTADASVTTKTSELWLRDGAESVGVFTRREASAWRSEEKAQPVRWPSTASEARQLSGTCVGDAGAAAGESLSLIHISEPTRPS